MAVLGQVAGQAHLQLCDWEIRRREATGVHGQAQQQHAILGTTQNHLPEDTGLKHLYFNVSLDCCCLASLFAAGWVELPVTNWVAA